MPEDPHQSFCERCGTRYTFESARQRVRLKGVKVLSRGLKNFVLSDSTSIDEAMASARAENDRQVTTNQLDAFHQTFSFCLSCRQYTCSNCWNTVEARCLSCAPEVAIDESAAAAGATAAIHQADVTGPGLVHETNGSNGHAAGAGAVIAAGATFQVLSEPAAGGIIEPVEVESPVELAAAAAEHRTDGAAAGARSTAAGVEPPKAPARSAASKQEPKPAAPATTTPRKSGDVGTRTAAQTTALLRRFRPGQNIDAELEAYGHDRTSGLAAAARAAQPAPAAKPVAAEREPIAAEPEPAPEPVAAEAPAAPEQDEVPVAAAFEPPPPAPPTVRMAPPRTGFGRRASAEPIVAPRSVEDLVAQPTWQRVAPDAHPEQQPSAPSTPVAPSRPIPRPLRGTRRFPPRPRSPRPPLPETRRMRVRSGRPNRSGP